VAKEGGGWGAYMAKEREVGEPIGPLAIPYGRGRPLWPKEGRQGEPFGPFGHPPPTGGGCLYGHPQRMGRPLWPREGWPSLFWPNPSLRPRWPSPTGGPLRPPMAKKSDGHPDGQRAFGHPLPSAYGRVAPFGHRGQRGEAGSAFDLMTKGAFGHPFGHPLREGRPPSA
jgi:hypothetical protein